MAAVPAMFTGAAVVAAVPAAIGGAVVAAVITGGAVAATRPVAGVMVVAAMTTGGAVAAAAGTKAAGDSCCSRGGDSFCSCSISDNWSSGGSHGTFDEQRYAKTKKRDG